MERSESPKLIEYIAICGVSQGALVDYLTEFDESSLASRISKEALKANGLTPKVLSVYPNKENFDFPLSPNLPDVLRL